jgi:hypothetical protein
MPEFDVSKAKGAIFALKKEIAERERERLGGGARGRHGRDVRRFQPDDRIHEIGPPLVDPALRGRPFAVWDFRNGNNAAFLVFTEVSEEWSAASFTIDEKFGSDFHQHDQITYYFFWQNDAGRDVVVNIQSALIIDTFCRISADNGLIRSPFWGGSTNGKARVIVTAELAAMEWWNQPPTQAPAQPSGRQEARDESISGGFFLDSAQNIPISKETYYLHHDGLSVPANGVVVTEVSLNFYYSGHDGGFGCDYLPEHHNHWTICPYVHFELT